jgi:hypothetical protein
MILKRHKLRALPGSGICSAVATALKMLIENAKFWIKPCK